MINEITKKISDALTQLVDSPKEKSVRTSDIVKLLKDYFGNHMFDLNDSALSTRKNNVISFFDPEQNKHAAIMIHFDIQHTSSTQPVTFNAGDLFNDVCILNNLSESTAEIRYLFYITDRTMWNYFMNKSNGYHHIFNQTNNMTVTLDQNFFYNKPNTFKKALKSFKNNTISLKTVYASSIGSEYKLRVFQIYDSPNNATKTLNPIEASSNYSLSNGPTNAINKELDSLKTDLIEFINRLGFNITEQDITIEDRGLPHTPANLPIRAMGIYMFYYQGQFLKIGKAGPNSNVRFRNNHYHPSSSNSNLAKSIIMDQNFIRDIDEQSVGGWIKENTRRIDIIIDQKFGMFVLNFIEAALHLKYKPRYEGFHN